MSYLLSNRFIGLLLFAIPLVTSTGSILESAYPIEIANQPVFNKVGSTATFTATTTDYTDILPIDGVVIRFHSTETPEVNFRFLNNNEWSDWVEAKIFSESNTDRWLASNIDEIAKKSTQFEIRITANHSDIILLEQGLFPKDEELVYKSTSKPIIYPTEIPKPTIISRQEWGARPHKGSYTQTNQFTKLTIHHAAGWPASNSQEGKIAVKEIQDFHMDGRGWQDIAYHFLIDGAGNIYQGRPETVQGAHTFNNNTGNIGICMLGCFDPPYEISAGISCHQHLTPESRDAIIHLFAWLIEAYGYPNADLLKGHRDYYDYARTSCPGQNIHQLLPELRGEINEYIQFGGPPFDYSIVENYPNPFFTFTNIEYMLPVESTVSVIIYNISGEEIITIIDEQIQSKGIHSITWNGYDSNNNLSHTGVYFYKIRTSQTISNQIDKTFSDTGKMLFLK